MNRQELRRKIDSSVWGSVRVSANNSVWNSVNQKLKTYE